MSHKTSKLIRRAFARCPLLVAMYGRLSDSQYKAIMHNQKRNILSVLAPDKRRVYQFAKTLSAILLFLVITPHNVSMGHTQHARTESPVDALVPRIIKVESNGNPRAISKKGAIGLMQVMPLWVPELKKHGIVKKGRDELLDPVTNVRAGKFILARYLEKHKGNVRKALHSYSGGAKNYYKKVMGVGK